VAHRASAELRMAGLLEMGDCVAAVPAASTM
jgi:hypothetical protein